MIYRLLKKHEREERLQERIRKLQEKRSEETRARYFSQLGIGKEINVVA